MSLEGAGPREVTSAGLLWSWGIWRLWDLHVTALPARVTLGASQPSTQPTLPLNTPRAAPPAASCLLRQRGCLTAPALNSFPPKAGTRKPHYWAQGWGPLPSPGWGAGRAAGNRRGPALVCQPNQGLLLAGVGGTAATPQAPAPPAPWSLQRTKAGGRLHAGLAQPAPASHRVVAGGVDDVHRGHVLVQEVAPDGNGVAATAVVFLDGHSRGKPGPCGAQAAPGRGGRGFRASVPHGAKVSPLLFGTYSCSPTPSPKHPL